MRRIDTFYRESHLMTRALFTQDIEYAFADLVGPRGADRARFYHWHDQLIPALVHLQANPPRAAAPIFEMPAAREDLAEIEVIGTQIAERFSDLIVVGMGGSSLSGETLEPLRQPGGLRVHYLDNIDPYSFAVLMDDLPWATTAVLAVSKSGGTVETIALLAVLMEQMRQHLANHYAKNFFIITVPNDNPMHRLATEQGMRVIAHHPDLGGRFSILSCVGLVPAAALGVDIRGLREGAQIALAENFSSKTAPAVESAALHLALMEKNISTNVMMHYSDRFCGLAAWYRQCWAESLGKQGKGTIPIASRGATDQHSQLQLFLEGPKNNFFTALILNTTGQGESIAVPGSIDPRLEYLKGHRLGDLSMAEQRATNVTLTQAGSPLRTLTCERLDAQVFGALIMHFTLEVIFTAELLGINAFDQPAVETSKKLTLQYLAGR